MGLSQENAHFLKENSTICRSFCKETMGHRFAISVLIYGRLYPTYVPIKSQLYLYPTCIRIIVFSYLYNSLYIYIYLQYIQYIPIISPSFHHCHVSQGPIEKGRRTRPGTVKWMRLAETIFQKSRGEAAKLGISHRGIMGTHGIPSDYPLVN